MKCFCKEKYQARQKRLGIKAKQQKQHEMNMTQEHLVYTTKDEMKPTDYGLNDEPAPVTKIRVPAGQKMKAILKKDLGSRIPKPPMRQKVKQIKPV